MSINRRRLRQSLEEELLRLEQQQRERIISIRVNDQPVTTIEGLDDLCRQYHSMECIDPNRLYPAMIWRRLECGIKIEDLVPSYYQQVYEIIENYYMPEETLHKSTNMSQDLESIVSFLSNVETVLNENKSLIAIDESKANTIAGFIIIREIPLFEFGRVLNLENGENLIRINKFKNELFKGIDIYAKYNCKVFFKIMLLCVVPEYRKKRLGDKLFETAIDLARVYEIPVITMFATGFSLKKLAFRFHMEVLKEIQYDSWLNENGQRIFNNTGYGNDSAALVGLLVPPAPKPPPIITEESGTKKKDKKQKK